MNLSPEYMILAGLLLLAVSLAASMLFGAMVPKDDYDTIMDHERARRDMIAMRPSMDGPDTPANPGQIALFPDGTLGVHLLNRPSGDGAYLTGDGRILHMGPQTHAENLRYPFITDRLT